MKFSHALGNRAAANAVALALALALSLALSRAALAAADLRFTAGTRHVVVRACPGERLFADAGAQSPNGSWLIGRGAYAPDAVRMVAEYRFLVDSGGRRILDRDFERAFGAPNPGSDIAWVPGRPATLRYTPSSLHGAAMPVRLVLPSRNRQANVCERL